MRHAVRSASEELRGDEEDKPTLEERVEMATEMLVSCTPNSVRLYSVSFGSTWFHSIPLDDEIGGRVEIDVYLVRFGSIRFHEIMISAEGWA